MSKTKRSVLSAAVLCLVGTAVLVTAASASAFEHPAKAYVDDQPTLHYEAGDGVVNDVVVRTTDAGYEIEDLNSTIVLDEDRAGGCRLATPHKLACQRNPSLSLTVDLADGNDFFSSFATDLRAQVTGSDGDDTFYGGPNVDTFAGGPGQDLIYGAAGGDRIDGDDGDDKIFGGDGADFIQGGNGDDEISGGDDNDYLFGDAGRDALNGDAGDEPIIDGGHGIDTLWGSDGDDHLYSISNDQDILHGDAGDDHMITSGYGDFNGGPGSDTMLYSYVRSGVTVTLDGKKNDHCSGCDNHFVHADIENVVGSQYDDKIYGNDSANQLSGVEGNDLLQGNGGDDNLDVGHGENQKEYGGPGVDTCVGYGLAIRDGCEH